MAIGEVKATFKEEFNTGFTAEITGSLEWDCDEEKRTEGRGGGGLYREKILTFGGGTVRNQGSEGQERVTQTDMGKMQKGSMLQFFFLFFRQLYAWL